MIQIPQPPAGQGIALNDLQAALQPLQASMNDVRDVVTNLQRSVDDVRLKASGNRDALARLEAFRRNHLNRSLPGQVLVPILVGGQDRPAYRRAQPITCWNDIAALSAANLTHWEAFYTLPILAGRSVEDRRKDLFNFLAGMP